MNVLITGGTGFLGRRLLAHYANREDTHRVCCYSRGEAMQWRVRDTIDGHLSSGTQHKLRWMIGDVRDAERLERACRGVDLVIHTAALKRVEVGEYCPSEMIDTNIGGTRNVMHAATRAGVKWLVLISSDKAVQPHNAYGATKMIAEKIAMSWHTENHDSPAVAVTRYGNVAGSTGSVIPIWRAMGKCNIRAVGTDPEATRYWMSVENAVSMIDRAGEILRDSMPNITATGPFVMVPTLAAYTLGDLEHAMWDRGEFLKRVEWTGLRAGEKLHESMVSPLELGEYHNAGTASGYYYTRSVRGAGGPDKSAGHQLTSSASAPQLSTQFLFDALALVPKDEELW